MATKRLFVAINSLLIIAAMTTAVSSQQASNGFGQDGLRFGPSARPFGAPESIFEDDFLNYDAQMWAPNDITSVDGSTEANTGFFLAHDWATLSVSNGAAGGNRFHWGNRYDIGYMSEAGSGFSIQWLNVNGSNFVNGAVIAASNPGLNETNLNIVELNRTFRQELSNGGFLEPYIGLRFSSISDNFIQDTGANRFTQNVTNSGGGGQVGARFVRAVGGRMNLIVDGTLSAVYNSQSYSTNDLVDPTGTNAFLALNGFSLSGDDVVPAMDLEAQFQFALTRDISLRAGAALNWQWSGIVRVNEATAAANPFSTFGPGFPATLTDTDTIAAGFTLGIDWRR